MAYKNTIHKIKLATPIKFIVFIREASHMWMSFFILIIICKIEK